MLFHCVKYANPCCIEVFIKVSPICTTLTHMGHTVFFQKCWRIFLSHSWHYYHTFMKAANFGHEIFLKFLFKWKANCSFKGSTTWSEHLWKKNVLRRLNQHGLSHRTKWSTNKGIHTSYTLTFFSHVNEWSNFCVILLIFNYKTYLTWLLAMKRCGHLKFLKALGWV